MKQFLLLAVLAASLASVHSSRASLRSSWSDVSFSAASAPSSPSSSLLSSSQPSASWKPRPEALKHMEFMVDTRRYLHAHPELRLNTFNTSALVASHLEEMGLEVHREVGKTGVVGVFRGAQPGPTILLRADMDGLPIQEADLTKPYSSQVPGAMHACGHDAHTATLLALARELSSGGWKDKVKGNIKFAFQPAEEGPGGAKLMIEDPVYPVLDAEPRVDQVFALHEGNEMDVGFVGSNLGAVMAASDSFSVLVKGRGGHGAYPQQTVDPVVAAAQLVLSLQSIVSRNVDPMETAVVSVGALHCGTASNVIPELCVLNGTVRTLHSSVQDLVYQRMQEVCSGVGATFGANLTLNYRRGYPVTQNTAAEATVWAQAAAKIVGKDNVRMSERSMGSEDFSYFLQKRPGCYWIVGSAPAGSLPDHPRPHHSPIFDINEDALLVGLSVWLQLVEDILVSS